MPHHAISPFTGYSVQDVHINTTHQHYTSTLQLQDVLVFKQMLLAANQLGTSHTKPSLPQVLRGNPLVQSAPDQELNFGVKRRWDDDVVFKNQDRGAPKKQQRFINDTIRSVQVLISSAMQLRAHLSVVAAESSVFSHVCCGVAGQTSTSGSWIATSSSK